MQPYPQIAYHPYCLFPYKVEVIPFYRDHTLTAQSQKADYYDHESFVRLPPVCQHVHDHEVYRVALANP
jgi:hypothetical protein